jgi:hypothetical protein
LGQHHAGGVVHRGEQVDLAAVGWVAGAAQGLAVDRDRPPAPLPPLTPVTVGQPGRPPPPVPAFGDLVTGRAGDVAVEDGDVVGVDVQQLQRGVTIAGDIGRDRSRRSQSRMASAM